MLGIVVDIIGATRTTGLTHHGASKKDETRLD
jgi:hypothetical protein